MSTILSLTTHHIHAETIEAQDDYYVVSAFSNTLFILDNDDALGDLPDFIDLSSLPHHASKITPPSFSFTGLVYEVDTNGTSALKDSFSYVIKNTFDETDTAWVFIDFDFSAPKLIVDSISTYNKYPSISCPICNDSITYITGFSITQYPNFGSISPHSSLDHHFDYFPDASYSGIDSFGYSIQDIDLTVDTSWVYISTLASPKVDVKDDYAATNGATLLIDVTINDDYGSFEDIYDITFDGSSVKGGSYSFFGTKVYYTPSLDLISGIDTVHYYLSDEIGIFSSATVYICYNYIDAMPDCFGTIDSLSINHDSACTDECEGSIYLSFDGTPPYTITWNNDAPFIAPFNHLSAIELCSGTYPIKITDSDSNLILDTIIINALGIAVIDAGIDQYIVETDTTILDVSVTSSLPYSAYWSPSIGLSDPTSLNPLAYPTETTTYTLTILDSFYCSSKDSITIFVEPCIDECAWPGDVNYDGICNNMDILYWSFVNGVSSSITRPAANINWIPQIAPNWDTSFNDGTNIKHADCNGDGLINEVDKALIMAHYTKTHGHISLEGDESAFGIPIHIELPDTLIPSDTLQLNIQLENDGDAIENFQGISFSLTYSSNWIKSSSISAVFPEDWPDSSSLSELFYKNRNKKSQVDFTILFNKLESGSHIIGCLSMVLKDILPTSSFFCLESILIKAMDSEQGKIAISPYKGCYPSILTSDEETFTLANISLYPNPVQQILQVDLGPFIVENAFIYDISGRLCWSGKEAYRQFMSINTSSLKAGWYVLQLQNGQHQRSFPFIVIKH